MAIQVIASIIVTVFLIAMLEDPVADFRKGDIGIFELIFVVCLFLPIVAFLMIMVWS